MPTTVTRYVNTGSTAGGDGTTNATTGANRAFASLFDWNAARKRDLVTADEIEVVECSGTTADTSSTALAKGAGNWITDATRYVLIKAGAGAGHAGVWDNTKYRISISGDSITPLSTALDYLRIDRLQIEHTFGTIANRRPGISISGTAAVGSSETRIENTIIRNCGQSGNAASGNIFIGSGSVNIRNSILAGSVATGLYATFGSNAPTVNIDNCTIVDNATYGIDRAAGTITLRNCYVGGNGTADYNGTMTRTTCAHSSATTYSGSTASVAYSTANFVNVTASTRNLHLVSGSALIGVGTDLSATFTTDIDGVTRAAPWDIGADEYVAGGNVAPNTPTITTSGLGSTTVTLNGSAFSDADVGDTHAASQWQVTLAADTAYGSPVVNTGDDTVNLTSRGITGLTASTAYIARVRYKDSAGNYSSYSTSVSFTTTAASDTTAPTFANANVNASGTLLTINLTEATSPPILPASGITNFTITASGGAATLSSVVRAASTQITANISRTILSGETVTLTYTVGNVTDSATIPNAMAAFGPTSVTNNSTQSSGSCPTAGEIASAVAAAILVTPANKLWTDVNGRVDIAKVAGADATLDATLNTNSIADAVCDEILSGHNTAGSLGKTLQDTYAAVDTEVAAILAAVDTEVAAIKLVTDRLSNMLELDGSVYRYTANSLEQAPVGGGGGGGATVDAIYNEPVISHTTPGTFGKMFQDIYGVVDTEVASILAAVDTEVAAIKLVTDRLSNMLELDGSVYRYTANSLEQAPAGGGGGGNPTIEPGWTLVDSMRLMMALFVGKTFGGGTKEIEYRDINDTKVRLRVTLDDNSNRLIVTKDVS